MSNRLRPEKRDSDFITAINRRKEFSTNGPDAYQSNFIWELGIPRSAKKVDFLWVVVYNAIEFGLPDEEWIFRRKEVLYEERLFEVGNLLFFVRWAFTLPVFRKCAEFPHL